MQVVYDVIFTQTATSGGPKRLMSTTKGFKTYESAVAAIVKEFTQLTKGAVPGKPVVGPVEASTLNFDEKKGNACNQPHQREVEWSHRGKEMR